MRWLPFVIFILLIACNQSKEDDRMIIENQIESMEKNDMTEKITKTDEEWRKELTPEQYRVLREQGTEAPFNNKYYECKDEGIYKCAGCGNELFASNTKYNSGSGWPSFWQPIEKKSIMEKRDVSHGMTRVEVVCNSCNSHLGHVFEDGPNPTGLRYCINSAALDLDKK